MILATALILRLININQSFWLDEAAQVIESARPLSEQLWIVSDFHPPGFHLLLHFWMLISHSEVWVRFLSVIFALGSIIGVYAIGKRIADEKTGMFAAIFLSLNPYHLWYSQEARPYMMLVFFATISTYALITQRWKLYSVSLIGAWYSTYFAPFIFLGQGIYILFFNNKKIGQFFPAHLIAFLAFVPWIPSFLEQLRVGTGGIFTGWTDVVSVQPVKAGLLTFAKFILGRGSIENNFLYTLAILPMTLIFFGSCWELRKTSTGKMLNILFFVPFFAAIIISFFVPVVAPQRLTFLLPIFVLILATGIANAPKKVRGVMLGIVILTSIAGILQYYLDPKVQREQWREAVQSIESEAPQNSLAVFIFPEPFAPYLWYQNRTVLGIGIAPAFILREEDLNQRLLLRLPAMDRIYLFHYLTGLTGPIESAQRYIIAHGFIDTDKKNFEGVGFISVYEHL